MQHKTTKHVQCKYYYKRFFSPGQTQNTDLRVQRSCDIESKGKKSHPYQEKINKQEAKKCLKKYKIEKIYHLGKHVLDTEK